MNFPLPLPLPVLPAGSEQAGAPAASIISGLNTGVGGLAAGIQSILAAPLALLTPQAAGQPAPLLAPLLLPLMALAAIPKAPASQSFGAPLGLPQLPTVPGVTEGGPGATFTSTAL